MKFNGWAVAFICCAILLAMLLVVGIVILFIDTRPILERIILSTLCICTSVAFGGVGYEMWKDGRK